MGKTKILIPKEIMMDESEPEKPKIHFKSIKKKRPIRQKDSSDEEESIEAVDKDAFEEILEIQKLRKRSKGVSAVTLASGKKVSKEEELIDPDPFKVKSGGLLTLDKARKAAKIEDEEREEEIGLFVCLFILLLSKAHLDFLKDRNT